MAARTYQPSLERLISSLNRFITRYQTLLTAHMTAPQAAYLAALSVALENMINSLSPGTGV